MTNLSNSSPRPKIVFIHGLNNNASAFQPLMDVFRRSGYEVELVILPGHGENRREASSYKNAKRIFEERMSLIASPPYMAIAFSHGALYLEQWILNNSEKAPLRRVLMAPAFAIRYQKLLNHILFFLPSFTFIKSLSPKVLRRYNMLMVSEYRVLLKGIEEFQEKKIAFTGNTLILIDPKDELVDAQKLKNEINEVQFWDRPYLKKRPGQHHVLFHPNYFSEKDWDLFIKKIQDFLVN
jgi:esterase/lipase